MLPLTIFTLAPHQFPTLHFRHIVNERTITITQPTVWYHHFESAKAKYEMNEQVSASISVPSIIFSVVGLVIYREQKTRKHSP
jgi:hypothetical protein